MDKSVRSSTTIGGAPTCSSFRRRLRNAAGGLVLVLLIGQLAHGEPESKRVDTLEQDVSTLKETTPLKQEILRQELQGQIQATAAKVDGIDKRIETVNAWLTGFGILITLLVAGAGFITYITGTRHARETAEEWLKENTSDLQAELTRVHGESLRIQGELDVLRSQAQQAREGIAAAHADVNAQAQGARDAIALMQQQTMVGIPTVSLPTSQAQAKSPVADDSRTKIESEFSPDDWAKRGYAAMNEAKYDSALHFFDQALSRGRDDLQVAQWLQARAWTLDKLSRQQEEIQVYDEIVQRFGPRTELPLLEHVAQALVNKGFVLSRLSRYDEELAVYEEVETRFHNTVEPSLQLQLAKALRNKGNALFRLGKYDGAMQVNDDLIRRFGNQEQKEMADQVANALLNKGFALGVLGRHQEVLLVVDDFIRRFGNLAQLPIAAWVARALTNKGVALRELGRLDEARQVFDDVERRFGARNETELQEAVAHARLQRPSNMQSPTGGSKP